MLNSPWPCLDDGKWRATGSGPDGSGSLQRNGSGTSWTQAILKRYLLDSSVFLWSFDDHLAA